ncbi:thioredoxin-like protein [Pelagophyceae sp. CCMP2097]|nr:thioredoxin-like protein [Pelagophyceae sp. CCMP2097]
MPVSGQHITGSKADIFTPVDVGGGGGGDEDASIKEAMSAEVDKRMNSALDDLKVKYGADGVHAPETSEHGPTGTAYRAKEREAKEASAQRHAVAQYKEAVRAEEVQEQARHAALDDEDSDDGDYLDGLDDEPDSALNQLREQRLAQMKRAQTERVENVQKGHGTYSEISQDDFLKDVLKSQHALVHFYHADFERCKIMDHHLAILAPQHVEAKFMRIDANKAPFFVKKLTIQVIPTVVVFLDGVAVGRLVGFDGLTDGLAKGHEDEWPTEALGSWLGEAGCIQFERIATEQELAKFTWAGARAAQMAGVTDHDEDD